MFWLPTPPEVASGMPLNLMFFLWLWFSPSISSWGMAIGWLWKVQAGIYLCSFGWRLPALQGLAVPCWIPEPEWLYSSENIPICPVLIDLEVPLMFFKATGMWMHCGLEAGEVGFPCGCTELNVKTALQHHCWATPLQTEPFYLFLEGLEPLSDFYFWFNPWYREFSQSYQKRQ